MNKAQGDPFSVTGGIPGLIQRCQNGFEVTVVRGPSSSGSYRLCTILHNTAQYYTILHNTTQYYTILNNTTKYYTIIHNTTQYHTVIHNTTQYYIIVHKTTQ